MGLELEVTPLPDDLEGAYRRLSEALQTERADHARTKERLLLANRPKVSEAGVMLKIEAAFEPLDEPSRRRVLRWMSDRWGHHESNGFVPTIAGLPLDREMPFEDTTRAAGYRTGVFSPVTFEADLEDLREEAEARAGIFGEEMADANLQLSMAEVIADLRGRDISAPTAQPGEIAQAMVEAWGNVRLTFLLRAFSHDSVPADDEQQRDRLRAIWEEIRVRLGLTYQDGG